MTNQLTEIALQMLGTIERMELIIPEITGTIRKALEEKAALTKPVPPVDAEVADPVIPGEYRGFNAIAYRNGFHAGHKHALTRTALERLVAVADAAAQTENIGIMDDAIAAARAALAAEPEPPVNGEVAELVNHLLKVAAEDESDGCTYDSAFTRRAAELLERLAPQPEPEVPSDAELWAVGDKDFQSNTWPTDAIKYARAVLARWGRP